MGKFLIVRLKSGLSGRPETQRRIVAGLGLRKMWREVELKDTPQTRGMINKVSHLVEVVREKEG